MTGKTRIVPAESGWKLFYLTDDSEPIDPSDEYPVIAWKVILTKSGENFRYFSEPISIFEECENDPVVVAPDGTAFDHWGNRYANLDELSKQLISLR